MPESVAAVAVLALSLAAGTPGADEHVLDGARLFREDRFAEALVEFRVAERLGARDARWYVAASLVKLDRPEEAVELFEGPGAPPAASDALRDYYRALACYESRLYVRADEILAQVENRAGPRIAKQVAKVRADIAAVLAKDPPRDSVEWYLARSDRYAGSGRDVLARAFAREARALGLRRADRYGVAAADGRLASLGDTRPVADR